MALTDGIADVRRALAFLTPIGGASSPSPAAIAWFPVVGAAIGGALGLLWWAGAKAWPLALVASLVVAADLGLTGLLHFDGLADSADGLLAHVARDRRLEIMREPGVGAFAVGVCGAVLLARWATLWSIRPAPLVLIGVWALSRAAMAVVASVVPYARAESGGGLASAFLADRGADGRAGAVAGVIGLVIGAGCLVAWRLGPGLAVVGAELVGVAGVVALAWRRLGGFTGDVLGAAGVVGETVALVVAAARW